MKLNAIYTTFNGEVNSHGIGSVCIFVRLQGCHLRCYKRTKDTLCDTPEGLALPKEKQPHTIITEQLFEMAERTGIKLVTLTGGDPLWNRRSDLTLMLREWSKAGFTVNIETSGTLDWGFLADIPNIHIIADYKTTSTGEENKNLLLQDRYLKKLTEKDFIKFVIDKEFELLELGDFLEQYDATECKAKIAVGCYWGGDFNPVTLLGAITKRGWAGRIHFINMQTHKMAVSSKYDVKIPKEI